LNSTHPGNINTKRIIFTTLLIRLRVFNCLNIGRTRFLIFTMSQKLITLVTGANQGLGYYAAQHLAATGEHIVLIGSRSLDKGTAAVKKLLDNNPEFNPSNLKAIQLDITDDKSIERAAEHVKSKYGHLSILINNAGIAGYPWSGSQTLREKFLTIYNTNVFGTAAVTDVFLPLIKASPATCRRIVFVSSTLGSMAHASEGIPAAATKFLQYSSSKSALNMIALHYASELKDHEIPVVVVCPGYCATNLNGYSGYKEAKDGADELLSAATKGGFEMHGKCVHEGGQIMSW
jgi:NAD(P)-dependent dehydrogenase (short-subunit alcohol dehydrogenase family)